MSKEYDHNIEDFNEFLECEFIKKESVSIVPNDIYEHSDGTLYHISDVIELWETMLNNYDNTGGNL